jgi:hypothetical protein
MDSATQSQLAELGLLVADEAHFDYPARRLRARPFQPEKEGAGSLPELPKDLFLSSRTLLRFTSDEIYAWAPEAPVRTFEQRYDRQLVLDREACAVLLSFLSPTGPETFTAGIPEETRCAYVAALVSAGILVEQLPPVPRRSPRASFEVALPELEASGPFSLSAPPASSVPSPESIVQRMGRGAATFFFVVVFYLLILPLGLMRRLSPAARRQRAAHRTSTWEPCRTDGLRDSSRYQLPY